MRRPTSAQAFHLLALLLPCLLAACAAPPGAPTPAPGAPAEIRRLLEASAEAWNRGDFEGFMQPYLDSDSTTFVTPAGLLHGRAAIEGRYRASYWKGGPPADRLRFGDVDVRMLGPDHALLTGRYHLVSPAGEPKGEGPFSLVLRRGPEGWRIVHDHSG